MRVQPLSDLHLEFYKDRGLQFIDHLDTQDADILVLAGDIMSLRFYEEALQTFRAFCKKDYKNILYTPGNHEYYKTDPKTAHAFLHDISGALEKEFPGKLRILLDPFVSHKIGNNVFRGGTMWFPDGPKNKDYESWMNDFYLIEDIKPWVYDQNSQYKKVLEDTVKEGDIMISHHLPSPMSIHPRYAGQPLNRFFLSNMEGYIKEKKPKLWFHGHTHFAFDYKLFNTRVVCNPRGYPESAEQGRNGFKKDLVIEI